jgi:putative flippase GtrA
MTQIIANPIERKRFLKFALVGTLGAVIDFGVMNLLTFLLHMDLVPAGIISFICAVISNFLWNRYWTYPESRSRHVLRQLIMFFLVNIAGVGIRIPILYYVAPPLMHLFDRQYFHNLNTADVFAKNTTLAIAVGIVMLWNFFVNRYWTYNDVTSEA